MNKIEQKVWGSSLPSDLYYGGVSKQLSEIAYSRHSQGEEGEIDLLVHLLVKAGKDRDFNFINGDGFKGVTKILDINYHIVYATFIRIIDYFDNGMGMIDISFLESDNEDYEHE